MVERTVNFGMYPLDGPSLDALLGSARGVFSARGLEGVRDNFNFDFKGRGWSVKGILASLGAAAVHVDANICGHGDVSIPVSGGTK